MAKLGTLLYDVCRWYVILALAFVILVTAAGFWMFSTSPNGSTVAWQSPWMVVVTVFGLSIVTNVLFAFVEGMGFITNMAMARFVQSVGAGLTLWLALSLGLQLFSLAAMYAANVAIALVWIGAIHGQRLLHLLARRAPQYRINWRTEIWPFQWRIAVSWVSGYLASLAITPIVFRVLGPVPAGQIGLSISICSAASFAALAWVSTKSAVFGRMVAEEQFEKLDQLYAGASRKATLIGILGMGVLVLLALALNIYLPQYAARILPPEGMAALALATIFNVKISSQAYYLRAFRREPFMKLSVFNGLSLTCATVLAAHFADVVWVAYCYSAITLSVVIFWSTPLFHRASLCFKNEHSNAFGTHS